MDGAISRSPEPAPTGRHVLPFSRSFALAGFGIDEAAEWRLAGFMDPEDARRHCDAAPGVPPMRLRQLLDDGYELEQVARVARFVGRNAGAWTRALVDRESTAIDLREQVRRNLTLGLDTQRTLVHSHAAT